VGLIMNVAPAKIRSLFGGPGGWCQGLVQSGVSAEHVGIEWSADACRTRRAAGHPTIEGDVRSVDPRSYRGKLDGLIGSPPCQSFSNAGKQSGRGDDYALDAICCLGDDCDCGGDWLTGAVGDERTALVIEPMRWIVEAQPTWVLLEQVPALEYMWEDIAAELFAAGWEWADVQVLDAADFGAPQHRKRVFLAAHRYEPRSMPRPTHGPGRANPWNTPQSVLGLDGTLGFPRRNDRPDGGKYRARDLRATDRPSFTLTEKVRSWKFVPADGSEPRPLTMPEISTLAGFPADYPWQGSRTSQCLQAANAVAPPVAAALISAMCPPGRRQALAA
jgi:DNA (cytosine-5)-methyltransferase 1